MGRLIRGSLGLLAILIFEFFPPSEAHAQKKVRFAYPSSADMGDIPSLLAWDELKKQGIEVLPTFFPKTDLAVQAVVAGEADIGSAAGIAVVKAVESGMNIRIIAEQVRNEWQLVTPVGFKDPKQLNGKRVAYHAPITVTEALVKWMAQHYKITPNWMIIPGSDVRAEALMRGQLDATPAEIGDVLNILSAKPGQFHVLISYAKTFPQLIGSMYFARADYLQKNAATVESVLEAILRAHRNSDERPASVKENALRLLPETKPELVDAIAAAYKELRIWDVNGGADKERGEASIKFFEESGLLKKGAVSFNQSFATGPLDQVLSKIGRRSKNEGAHAQNHLALDPRRDLGNCGAQRQRSSTAASVQSHQRLGGTARLRAALSGDCSKLTSTRYWFFRFSRVRRAAWTADGPFPAARIVPGRLHDGAACRPDDFIYTVSCDCFRSGPPLPRVDRFSLRVRDYHDQHDRGRAQRRSNLD